MRRTNPVRLSVSPLEGREVPACIVTHPAPDTIVIVGNGANDTVVLRDNGAGFITGSATGAGAFAFAGIRNIRVATGAGNDTVLYNLYANLMPTQQRSVSVDLGPAAWWGGSDRFVGNLYNPATGVGSDLLFGSSLTLNVFGGDGPDAIYVNASRDTDVAFGAKLAMNLSGGTGADNIQAYWWGENDGEVSLWADGGNGGDLIRGRLQEQFGSTGRVSGVVKGGEGNDNLGLFLFTQHPPVVGLLDGGLGIDVGFSTANVTKVNVP
jgi:hypothetical protein